MAIEFQGAKELRVMAQQIRQLSRDIQQADAEVMHDELEALKPAVRRSAAAMLPAHGGLNKLVAGSDLKVKRRGRAVILRASSKANIRRMNNLGMWRHPIFALREKPRDEWRWVDQTYRPARRWFDNPTLSAEMRLRRAVDRNRQRILDRVR